MYIRSLVATNIAERRSLEARAPDRLSGGSGFDSRAGHIFGENEKMKNEKIKSSHSENITVRYIVREKC